MIFALDISPGKIQNQQPIKISSKNKLYVFTAYVNSEVKKVKINEKFGNHSAVDQ